MKCDSCGKPATRFLKRGGDLVDKGAMSARCFGICNKHYIQYKAALVQNSQEYFSNRLTYKETTEEEYLVSEVMES
jgi:hypothetical protein